MSTLKRRLVSISMVHRLKGHYLDTKHPINYIGVGQDIHDDVYFGKVKNIGIIDYGDSVDIEFSLKFLLSAHLRYIL